MPKPKPQTKLPELTPKKDPRGGGGETKTTGFNDNITLVRGLR